MRLVLRRISVTFMQTAQNPLQVCLDSRQTSLDMTISSSSIPQGYEVDCNVSRAVKMGETEALVTKTECGKMVCRPLKRKTRNAQGRIPGKFPIL